MIKLKSLAELEYPLASKDDLHSYGGMLGWKGKLVWMPPEKFLGLVHSLPDYAMSEKSYWNLRDRMINGKPIDFLVLKIDPKRNKVIGHEGRHRATVAKELGIKKVPVMVWFGEDFPRVPKWTDKEHGMADTAEFKPEWSSDLQEKRAKFSSSPKVSAEDKREAAALLYQFFKERDTLPWMYAHEWDLTDVYHGGYLDGDRYRFDYTAKEGRLSKITPYPDTPYSRPAKLFRTPKDAIEYVAAADRGKEHEDQMVFRGMNMAEWVDAKKKGYIQSNAKYNIGDIQWTYFGREWTTAHSYAGGFAPFDKEPTRSLPGVIIAVPKELTQPARDVTGQNTDTEYVAEKIPLDKITGVWYIVPIEVGKGYFELVRRPDKAGTLDRGSAAPTPTKYAIVPKYGIALE